MAEQRQEHSLFGGSIEVFVVIKVANRVDEASMCHPSCLVPDRCTRGMDNMPLHAHIRYQGGRHEQLYML